MAADVFEGRDAPARSLAGENEARWLAEHGTLPSGPSADEAHLYAPGQARTASPTSSARIEGPSRHDPDEGPIFNRFKASRLDAIIAAIPAILAVSAVGCVVLGAITWVMWPREPGSFRRKQDYLAVVREAEVSEKYNSTLAVTACDLTMKDIASLPNSYRSDWSWREHRDAGAGTVDIHRRFRAKNLLNADIEGSYVCVVDAFTNDIVGFNMKARVGPKSLFPGHDLPTPCAQS